MSPAESQKKAGERSKLARLQWEEDLRMLLDAPAGRRVFFKLINAPEHAGVVCSSFAAQAPDVGMTTAYNEGRRAVGIELMQDLQRVAPALFVAMLTEQVQAENARDAERRAEGVPGTHEDSRS